MGIQTRTLSRNIGYLSSAQILSSVFGFVTLTVLSRALGPAHFGILGFGTAVLGFLGILTTLGSDQLGAREIARSPDHAGAFTARLLSLRIMLATLAYGILIIFDLVTSRGELESRVLLIQGLGLFVTAFTLDYLFQGLRQLGWVALRQIATASLVLIATVLVIKNSKDLIAAAWIYVAAGGIVVLLILLKGVQTILNHRFEISKGGWGPLFAAMIPIAISGTMQAFILNTDLVMLGIMRTHDEVGLYTAAVRISILVLIPAGLVITALFPELARHTDDKGNRSKSARQYTLILLFIGLPLPCLVVMQPMSVLQFVFGDSFLAGTYILKIMMITTLVTHLRMIFDTPLITWNMEHPVMKISVMGATTNVVLNAALIPNFGMIGAVSASLASQLIMMLAFGWLYRTRVERLPFGEIFRVIACAAVAYAFTFVVIKQVFLANLTPALQMLFTFVSFGSCYLFLGYGLVWRQLQNPR